METRIAIIQGDITKVRVDAIVNAANPSLLGGGGVDGAIHHAAGPGLLEVCKLLGGCATGEAKTTPAFKLPARFVIHTVGPVWGKASHQEEELLANCYRNCLMEARGHQCRSIAFPNISTGIYHFPKNIAARIAITEVSKYLLENALPEKVMFVCYDDENFTLYKKHMQEQSAKLK